MNGRTLLTQVGIWTGLVVLVAFVVNLSMLGIQSGLFPTSTGNAYPPSETSFTLQVSAAGETVYTSARAVTEELREEIMGTTYPTPDAAIDAVVGVELAGNVAQAHAKNVCWRHRYGKVSNQTGGGRHLTWWRKDYRGFRYTTTAHQVLTQNGYQTISTFKIRTN